MPAPNVLLVFPKFNENSFWSFASACELYGVRCVAPPLGLITLAGLLPPAWNLRLVNRNAAELSDGDVAWADLVLTGGMLPQQLDTLALIERCRRAGKPVAVGGPDPTSSPHIYEHADFLVTGEAEGAIDAFVAAWEAGERRGRFDAAKFQVDVSRSPVPRFDLLRFADYMYVGVQFSRGCPFNCEFCDIIELYGRVPRTKTNGQMLGELDRLHALGYRGHVDFVDDNLIGNKKALKRLLPDLIAWQKERGYPFKFSTEASLNLADDAELLDLLRQANFFAVFIGIESPDAATLVSAQKKQNTRRSIADSVHRIYHAGIFVTAGFIVGFDTEAGAVSEEMIACIEATSIPVCMVGLLVALPNTQLTRRLLGEGRLLTEFDRVVRSDVGDQCSVGLNFVTLRPRRAVIADYREVLARIYRPARFFARVRAAGRAIRRVPLAPRSAPMPAAVAPDAAAAPADPPATRKSARRRIAWPALRRDLGRLTRIGWGVAIRQPTLVPHFWATVIHLARRNPAALEFAVMNMVLYLHLRPFSKFVIRELDGQIARLDAGAP